jgi:hypothetical protein
MKRLIVCCDGTWQKISSPYPTNVAKFVQAVKTNAETPWAGGLTKIFKMPIGFSA